LNVNERARGGVFEKAKNFLENKRRRNHANWSRLKEGSSK
jgi:hypothetical protein